MSLTFKHTIVHVLDQSIGMPILSTDVLPLDNETEDFITKHLIKIFESSSSCEAIFTETASLKTQLEVPLVESEFISLSTRIAQKFYAALEEIGTIPNGDLICTSFMMDGNSYFGVFKLNYKEEYTHYVAQEEGTVLTTIIKNKGIFPSGGKNLEEGIIFSLETPKVWLLDTSKSKYVATLFEVLPALSVKETIKAIEKVATTVIEEHFSDPLQAMTTLKNNISESITLTQTIPIQEVMEKTFGHDEVAYNDCIQKIDEVGIKDIPAIEVTDPKISNKFATHKIKTDTGIEIKLPNPIFLNDDFVQIINEPNGTISIVLKNISKIINK